MNEAHLHWRARVREFVTREIEPQPRCVGSVRHVPGLRCTNRPRGRAARRRVSRSDSAATPRTPIRTTACIFAEEMHRPGSGVVFADLATHWIGLPPVVQFGSENCWRRSRDRCSPASGGWRLRSRSPAGGSDAGALADTRRAPRRPLARQRLEDADLGRTARGLHSHRRPHGRTPAQAAFRCCSSTRRARASSDAPCPACAGTTRASARSSSVTCACRSTG